MSLIPEPSIEAYAPFLRSGTVFVSGYAVNDEPIFGGTTAAHLLRSVLRQVKAKHPFTMIGYTILPDHLHLLIRPAEGVPAAQIVAELARQHERQYLTLMGIPNGMEVWAQRRELEPMRNIERFAHRLDTVHYDAVHHGQVDRPEAWSESSYAVWLERGLYKLGWGWQRPQRLGGG